MFGSLERRLNFYWLLRHPWPETFSSVVCLGQREPTEVTSSRWGILKEEGVASVFRKAVITGEHGLGVAGVSRTGDRERDCRSPPPMPIC